VRNSARDAPHLQVRWASGYERGAPDVFLAHTRRARQVKLRERGRERGRKRETERGHERERGNERERKGQKEITQLTMLNDSRAEYLKTFMATGSSTHAA